MKTIKQHNKNTLTEAKNQLVLPMGISFEIKEGTPVRQLWEVLEEMDFTAMENSFERSRNSTADAQVEGVLGVVKLAIRDQFSQVINVSVDDLDNVNDMRAIYVILKSSREKRFARAFGIV